MSLLPAVCYGGRLWTITDSKVKDTVVK